MQQFLIALIKLYQLVISPLSPPSCRFYPSCSHYCLEAIARFGPWKGSWLSLRRILRCNPWGGNGYDPVPPLPTTGDILTANSFSTDALLNPLAHPARPSVAPPPPAPPTDSGEP